MKQFLQQIIVEDIRIKDPVTGSGATQSISPDSNMSQGSSIDPDKIAEVVNDLADLANIRTDRFTMTYTLKVLAPTKRAAQRRARAFTRAKNPFEPRLNRVNVTDKFKSAGDGDIQPMFTVQVVVRKR